MKHFNKKAFIINQSWLIASDVDSSIVINGKFIFKHDSGSKKPYLFKIINVSTGKEIDDAFKPSKRTFWVSNNKGLESGSHYTVSFTMPKEFCWGGAKGLTHVNGEKVKSVNPRLAPDTKKKHYIARTNNPEIKGVCLKQAGHNVGQLVNKH